MIRVGHKGADAIVPGNTLASFDAALAAGVDMIEFDVLPEHWDRLAHRPSGELLIAHDYEDASSRTPPTLAEALAHLARPEFEGLAFDVDLKLPRYEEPVLAALQAAGLDGRSLVCSQYPRSLARLRALGGAVRTGWSVPRVRRDYTQQRRYMLPALAAVQIGRRELPVRAAAQLRHGRIDAVMAHWRFVTKRLVEAVHREGGELYVWTVDDAAAIRSFEALGVDGVITNDPRLFSGSRRSPR